jgi:hypothetical protein
MKDGYPYQLACDTSQRDFQDLLASFRQVTEERNALRSDNERLYEVLEGVPDAWLHRYQFRGRETRGPKPSRIRHSTPKLPRSTGSPRPG